jgi:NAD(P)H dehydrogenase (quinone)
VRSLAPGGTGKVSGAPRADYAVAAAAALLADEQGDDICELGGTAFSFEELAGTISEVTGRTVARATSLPSTISPAPTGRRQ